MYPEIEQAIQAANNNDLQEAILNLCDAIKRLESEINYIRSTLPD